MTTIITVHGRTYEPAPDDLIQTPSPLVTLEGDGDTKPGKFTYRMENGKLFFLEGVARLHEGLGNTYRVTPEPVVETPTPTPTPTPAPSVSTAPKPGEFAWGANFPNASNGSGVGTVGKEYSYQSHVDFYQSYRLGARLFRLGYRTTRIMQSGPDDAGKTVGKWDQPLIADAVTKIRQNIKDCLAIGPDAVAIPEMHDYGRAFGVQYGVAPFDVAWIVKFWVDLLGPELMGHPRVYIDLNNEPHLSDVWHDTVRELVPALRAAGVTNTLVLEGLDYSGARGWAGKNGAWFLDLLSRDPNLMASPHLYADGDNSGANSTCSSNASGFADSFIAWAKENKVNALIGEFGYSTGDSCKPHMPVLMEKFREAGIWVTAWTYSFYMPTGKYHFGLARPSNYAVEPSNLFRSFAAEANK